MDHHSWRPRPPPPPPIHANLCPTCSISHFPFCPPPPPLSFNQNPRFPSSTPFFDQHLPNLHRPFLATPGDRFGDDPHFWHRNPSFEYDHGGAGFKRMRVDEIYSGRSLMDDERRLKLIRDHGGLTSDSLHESSVLDTNFSIRNDTFLKPQINYGMNEFRDSRFISDFDRKGTSFRQDPDFGPNNTYGDDEHGGQKRLHSYRDEDIGHNLNTGVREYYCHHSFQSREPHIEQRSSFAMENCDPNDRLSQPYAMQKHMHTQINGRRQLYDGNVSSHEASLFDTQHLNKRSGYVSNPVQGSRVFNVQPPLPGSPPPPLPVDPPSHRLSEPHALYSPAKTSSSLFPIPVSSVATVPSLYVPNPEGQSLARPYFRDKSHLHASTGFATQEFQTIRPSSTNVLGEGQPFPIISSDKPKVVDASHIFKQPHRVTRPNHIVIILRGLPGSGKSYLAKMLRDLEVDNGGDAPRIHSIDDYFMTEVEKVEESDVSKSSGSVRGKKPGMKKVMEYCYEPEMEEAYRSSMLKAFKRTLDEGAFSFVIVDDRNLRVADFAQFWATAKRSGYEVYLLEATYKDPAGCAARNVHGFTQDDIQKMTGQWEEASSLYLKLDVKSLFQGDDLKESGIQEVDMDTEDGDSAGTIPGSEERNSVITVSTVRDYSLDGSSKDDKKWDAEGDHLREEVKELGRSKWSNDLDDDHAERADATERNLSALSGLIKAYAKEGKSVHWGDQVGKTGFSIGVARKENTSLVIGPGAGYNLKSNPLPEEQTSTQNTGEPKRQSVFQERIRAERESFRAVFDKRRQRISGLDLEDE